MLQFLPGLITQSSGDNDYGNEYLLKISHGFQNFTFLKFADN